MLVVDDDFYEAFADSATVAWKSYKFSPLQWHTTCN